MFSGSQRAKKANRRVHRLHFGVEALEDRSVPASFTAGDLAVFLADSSTLSNTSFHILEVNPTTPSATPVQSIAIASGLRASGSASSTGYLSLSNNDTYLAFDTANTANTTTNTNTVLSRSVGTLDLNGNFAIAASYTGANGNQPRGATSIDDSTWYVGDQGGIYTNNATTPTPAGNFRATKVFGGTVYTLTASSSAANVVVDTVSISGSGAVTGLPGLTNDAAAVDFTLVSSGANGSAYDVLYITDDTSATVGAIKKFALIGGTWTAEGTATTTGLFGITAAKDAVSGFDIYATTGNGSSGSNMVVSYVDSSAWNAPISLSTATTLFTTATATNLKGIAFVPSVSASSTILSSSTGGTAVYGTATSFTATITSGGNPVTSGTVQFSVDGNPVGVPVAVNGSGQATSAAISNLQVTGSPHVVTASYSGAGGTIAPSIGTLSGGQSVTPLTLSVAGITADNKIYDGTTAGTAELHLGSASVSGAIPGDDVSVVTTAAVGTFDGPDVNTATKIVVSGLTLGGAQQADYQLPATQATVAAQITPAGLIVTGITASDKPYDGNTTATLNTATASLSATAAGDTGVTLNSGSATGTFASPNSASGITVQVAGLALAGTTQDGTAANIDYTLTQPTAMASIMQVGSTATVTWTDGTSTTFNGNPHGATASWASTGTDGGSGSLPVTYVGISGTTYGPTSAAPISTGHYQASASFAGDTNHTGSSNTANFTINAASLSLVVVNSVAIQPSTNLATDNDFTRFVNAFASVAAGGTVQINGTLDWSESHALASWQATGEAYALPHLDGITVDAGTAGSGVHGPGDDPTVSGEGPFYFDGLGTDKGWNITGLTISNFDTAIFYSPEADVTSYAGTHLINNTISVPSANPGAQNGGIILGPSANQTVQGNTINIAGNGGATSASFGIDAFTFPGAGAWNNLLIDNNTVNVTTAGANGKIIGIAENSGSTGSNITVTNNTFNGDSGSLAGNQQVAFGITSQNSATGAVVYTGNKVNGAKDGFVWGDPEPNPAYNFAAPGDLPIAFSNTTLTNVGTGFFARDGGTATINSTTITNTALFNFGTAFAADGAGTVITVADPTTNFTGVSALKNETNGGLVIFQNNAAGIQNVSKAEGNIGFTLFSFPVTLGAPLSANQTFTVDYATASGTADGNDYNTANGTLTIQPGQSSGTIAVKVLGDFNPEPDETFFVNLSNAILFTNGAPKAATLASTQAVGTILNDDVTNIAASISGVSQAEGNQGATATPTPFVFPVTLNSAPAAGQFFTVDYATSNGTADGNDYVTANGTLTFFAGSTTPASPLTVSVIGDTIVEPNETFNVTLSNPQLHFTNAPQTIPGNLGTATAVGTIVNDDVASGAVVSVSSFSHVEGTPIPGNSASNFTTFTFTISYTGTLTNNIKVNWATANGTALGGQDYQQNSGQVTLTPTVTSATFTVTVFADKTVEPDETFFVNLSNPGLNGFSNYTLGTATGTGTIVNDD